MAAYFLRRLALLPVTFLGITFVTFLFLNLAPGGPLESKLQSARFGSAGGQIGNSRSAVVSEQALLDLKKQYGFDRPILDRYVLWVKNILHWDFGQSFKYEEPVSSVLASKALISLQFGFLALIFTYLLCVPLGLLRAMKPEGAIDRISGILLAVGYAVPPVVLGLFLIVVFAGSSYFSWFPLGGLYSTQYTELSVFGRAADRLQHLFLPLLCYVLAGFSEISLLTRNSMLDVMGSEFVRTAKAKGLSRWQVLWRHGFRNALTPLVAGLPGYIRFFLAGSVVVEQLFDLDGLGLLAYQSILARDYNVIMGLVFVLAFLLLLSRLFSDLLMIFLDPRMEVK